MKNYSMYEAKAKFSSIVDEVLLGQECTILRHGKPVAMLVPYKKQTGKRKFGTLKKKIKLGTGWDQPLSPKELKEWGL